MVIVTAVLILALSGPMPERGSFRGQVAIEAPGSGIVVYADTNHDQSIDHRFKLQFEPGEEIGMPLPLVFQSAHVEFEPGYVRIIAGNDAVELVVAGSSPSPWNPRGIRVWRRAGYGLAHNIGEIGVPVARPGRDRSITAEWCDASSDCDGGDTSEGGGGGGGGGGGTTTTQCDSGGPGSTSCSTSGTGGSCTTTCGTGYYACCMQGSPPKCRCIRG